MTSLARVKAGWFAVGLLALVMVVWGAAPVALGQGAIRRPPPAHASTAIICHADEPGPRLLIVGRIDNAQGAPVPGATVNVYNTDARGLYNPPNTPTREPRIRGTVFSDADGNFQVLTVKPGAYPDGSEPMHIHLEVLAPGYMLRYSDIWFEGDPLITPERTAVMRRRTSQHTNEVTKIERLERGEGGIEIVRHRVTLEGN